MIAFALPDLKTFDHIQKPDDFWSVISHIAAL